MTIPTPVLELNFSDPGDDEVWVVFTPQLKTFDIDRGRNSDLDRTESGTAVAVLNDPNRVLDPLNTSSVYYPTVRPMRGLRLSADIAVTETTFRMRSSRLRDGSVLRAGTSTTAILYTGFIQSIEPRLNFKGHHEVVLRAADALALFALSDTSEMTYAGAWGSFPFYPIGEAMGIVLDYIGWPEGKRDLEAGAYSVYTQTTGLVDVDVGPTAFDGLGKLAQAEGGFMFVSRDGAVVFYDSAHVLAVGDGDIWGDAATERQAFEIEWAPADVARLFNVIEVSTVDPSLSTGAAAVRQSPASIAKYWDRIYTLTILNAADTATLTIGSAGAVADDLLARYANPQVKIVSLRPRGEVSNWRVVLNKDLFDTITANFRPTSGSAISQDSQIENIHIGFAGINQWSIGWGLSAIPPTYPSLLTENQQSFETSTTGWVAESGCSIAQSTLWAKIGAASLEITGTAPATDAKVVTTPNNSIAVTAFAEYAATAYIAKATGHGGARKYFHLEIDWRTAANAFISTSVGASVRDVATAFVGRACTIAATAPATAAFGVLRVVIEAADTGELHYADAIGFNRTA